MNKKTIIGIIAVAGIIYLLSKAKKSKTDDTKEVGGNATATRSSFNRGSIGPIIIDKTSRRCVDATGKVIYVNGPCPDVRHLYYGCKDGQYRPTIKACANHGGAVSEHQFNR